ncbi:MAG: hypothetical protein PVG56_10390, partial [Anaerolineae bacterium]
MKDKWKVAAVVTLFVVVLATVFSQGAGQALAPQADLIVSKSVDKPAIAPGERVIYSIVINNTT